VSPPRLWGERGGGSPKKISEEQGVIKYSGEYLSISTKYKGCGLLGIS